MVRAEEGPAVPATLASPVSSVRWDHACGAHVVEDLDEVLLGVDGFGEAVLQALGVLQDRVPGAAEVPVGEVPVAEERAP